MNNLIKAILFFLLIGFFFNSDYFERNFFLNEFYAFLGIIVAFLTILKHPKISTKANINELDFWVKAFIFICLFHLIISIPRKTNWYYYARNSVIFYSVFAYFFGKYFFVFFNSLSNKLIIKFRFFVVYAMLIQKSLMARYSGPILFPLLFRRVNFKIILILTILIISQGILYDALSVIILALFIVIFWIIPNFRIFKLFSFFSLLALMIFYIYFHENIILYKDGEYNYFMNVFKVYNSHYILGIDHNTSWRVILWYRFIIERFPENILGIGFGTPLLHYEPNIQTASMVIDEVHAHVSGAHNTFITLFVRLGLVGLFILYKICMLVFKDFYMLKFENSDNPNLRYHLIWFVIFSLGLFNLCLESPLRASLFWISLGFIAKMNSMKQKKNENRTI